MKKFLLLCVMGIFSVPTLADNHIVNSTAQLISPTNNDKGKGGFQGPSKSKRIMRDVISALNASDDSKIQLTGRITMSVGEEKYIFEDPTGDITVEIDDDIWLGRTITPETNIVIRGEVEKDWNKISIDVDSLDVIE